jgi:integrase/recombinase XerD
VTHLRQMTLEELERRNYSEGTTRRYLRFVERFAQHFGKSPDKLSPDHLRSYQAYLLKVKKLDPGTVENHVAALRFLFIRTLGRHQFRQFLPSMLVVRRTESRGTNTLFISCDGCHGIAPQEIRTIQRRK